MAIPIHVISCTAVTVDGALHNLAMCGEDLGPYAVASETHPTGNYATERQLDRRVTCAECRRRTVPTYFSGDKVAMVHGAEIRTVVKDLMDGTVVVKRRVGNDSRRTVVSADEILKVVERSRY